MAQHLDAVLHPQNAYFVQKEWQFCQKEESVNAELCFLSSGNTNHYESLCYHKKTEV
jgi:hypothetical protein